MTTPLAAAKASLRQLLEREEGFVGVGIGGAGAGDRLILLVTSRESAAFSNAPAVHEGFPVVVEVAGRPRAL